jgi:hypothetical protein
MGDLSSRRAQFLLIVASVLCAAGMWLYANRVLIPNNLAYDIEHELPHGSNSDLYPRWLGARELLLHGRDPYTMEITREIQAGMFGRPLPPDEYGAGQNYQQGFYYPVYVAFLLAPTFDLPFDKVKKGFFWVLVALTVISMPLWLRLLRWRLPFWMQVACVIFSLGSMAVMQGLKLGQMTLLVLPLMAAAMVLLAADRQVLAGILLALATIKPQFVCLLLFWLAIWTLGDWRRRSRWAASFLIAMAFLCVASEYFLPHWILRFWQATWEFRHYTGEMPVAEVLMGPWGHAFELLVLALMMRACWRERRAEASSEAFAFMVALVLAITVLLVPSYHPYNQALLIPAILIMVKERRTIWRRRWINRVLTVMTIVLAGWPWLAAFVVASLSFVFPAQAIRWATLIPVWTALAIPIGVAAAILVYAEQRTFASGEPAPS